MSGYAACGFLIIIILLIPVFFIILVSTDTFCFHDREDDRDGDRFPPDTHSKSSVNVRIPMTAPLNFGCCDPASTQCLMSVELRFVSADFGATTDTPHATYSLGVCFANLPLIVDITTLTIDEPLFAQSFETTTTTDDTGQFAVDIPLYTTDVQVSVRILQSSSTPVRQQTNKKVKKKSKSKYAVQYGESQPTTAISSALGTQFAITQTNADNFRKRSLLSVHKDDNTLLSQYLMLLHANRVALDTCGVDHMPDHGQQLGPLRATRAMAIVQIAVMDAVIVVTGAPLQTFSVSDAFSRLNRQTASLEAAVAQATHDTLVSLFPLQKHDLDKILRKMLASIEDSATKSNGILVGMTTARVILNQRSDDGSNHAEQKVGDRHNEYNVVDVPGIWSPDPISKVETALGSLWSRLVDPFTLHNASQFRAAPPPAFDTAEYIAAYEETKALGGDGTVTYTVRSDEQTAMGVYYAYDGDFPLCSPPRLYNELLQQLGVENIDDPVRFALLLALGNIALADAGLAAWDSKYEYNFWRPVTAIRARATSEHVASNPKWTPLGAPSGFTGTGFTPPFPTYPSGHATFGGAAIEVLRTFLGHDNVTFTFISDELNGDIDRLSPRSFTSLSQFEEENGYSRVLLGIHWRFDSTAGIAMGHAVAQHTLANAYTAYDK
jgi:hypothetical protein